MDEMPGMIRQDGATFPRTRGGDPLPTDVGVYVADFAPHTRG